MFSVKEFLLLHASISSVCARADQLRPCVSVFRFLRVDSFGLHTSSLHGGILRLRFSILIIVMLTAGVIGSADANAQTRRRQSHASVCGNPQLPCKTSATFQAYDLPFRLPENAVIYDTELFYAILLKSVGVSEDDCDVFVPEPERLAAQALFPDRKVFTSRCPDIETMAYTNVSPKHRFMAVYAGSSLAEARRVLQAVKATGKFSGAMVRRMRTGFNGT
jgi:hypothetical protein